MLYLCDMPGAVKLPAATVVELVEDVLQCDIALDLTPSVAYQLLHQLRPPLPSHILAPLHVKRLLALLLGRTSATADAAYFTYNFLIRGVDAPSIMVWLAEQPGAAAAVAELGLTAADVPDPAAVALLFGGQRDEGDDSDQATDAADEFFLACSSDASDDNEIFYDVTSS
jgi:hypothetical protein